MSNIATMMNLAADAKTPTKYIGGYQTTLLDGLAITASLSSIPLQKGDLILAVHVVGEDSDERPYMVLNSSSQDFTLLQSSWGNDTYDVNMKVYGKIADGTETSVGFDATRYTTSSVGIFARVYRGPKNLPKDSSTGYYSAFTAGNTDDITWPEVTNTKTNELLIYIGATGHISGTPYYTVPTDLTDYVGLVRSDTEDFTAGMGHKYITGETSFTANQWLLAAGGTSSAVTGHIIRL